MPDNIFLDRKQWGDLLSLIEAGQVIPVIGSGLILVPSASDPSKNEKLTVWLGRELCGSLDVDPEKIRAPKEVSDVIETYYRGGHKARDELSYDLVLSRIREILVEESFSENRFPPAQALRDLANITDFKVFLTTTYDGMLQSVLQTERPDVEVIDICGSSHDLPENWSGLSTSSIIYLLGRYENLPPRFAASRADIIDYILALYKELKAPDGHRPGRPYIAEALTNKRLLLLGMNYDDWLTRFFIHLACKYPWFREERTDLGYIADDLAEQFVFFIEGTRRKMRFIPGQPDKFVAQMYERWKERKEKRQRFGADDRKENRPAIHLQHQSGGTAPIEDEHKGRIFISYASENRVVAHRLVEYLEKAGCKVWIDKHPNRDNLSPGDPHWRIIYSVIDGCSAFISLISSHTESAWEGGYVKERKRAAKREEAIASGRKFYVPIIVDENLTVKSIHYEPTLSDKVSCGYLKEILESRNFGHEMRRHQKEYFEKATF